MVYLGHILLPFTIQLVANENEKLVLLAHVCGYLTTIFRLVSGAHQRLLRICAPGSVFEVSRFMCITQALLFLFCG